MDRKVERIGHRGAPRRFLENTTPGFAEAIRLGADAVELDVHVTSDGQVVVHHDPALGPTIRPRSLARKAISAVTGPDIIAVDLGDGSRIPRLDEVLAVTRGRVTTYVEVKAGDIQAVVDVIAGSGATCAIHSFDHDAVATAREIAPHIPRGVLFDKWPVSPRSIVARTAARDVWPRHTLVTRDRVREIHDLGCRVIVWTVNDANRARELVEWGVDGICSDDLTLL
ncbi:MAG: glycerophosphodiester phosphodiesterase [Gemmatimonadaceae bacterium]